jgi:hypothetical protein
MLNQLHPEILDIAIQEKDTQKVERALKTTYNNLCYNNVLNVDTPLCLEDIERINKYSNIKEYVKYFKFMLKPQNNFKSFILMEMGV